LGWLTPLSPANAGHPTRLLLKYVIRTRPQRKSARQPPCQLPLFLLDCRPALESPMTPFFVQIKCELGKSYQVANQLAEAEIASEIYSTAGDFDLLVKFYVDSGTDIGHFVNEKVQCISGIKDTHTIITFKAFQV
jgi:DNA-binding Lrp family transcriptional regulator